MTEKRQKCRDLKKIHGVIVNMIHAIKSMKNKPDSPIVNELTFNTLLEEAMDKLIMASHTVTAEYLIYDTIIHEYDNDIDKQLQEQQKVYGNMLNSLVEKTL